MSQAAAAIQKVELDLSDVKHRVGQEVGGGEPIEPCSASDIRRWVMAMDYPNPIHWDEEFARGSKFGGIVAPQSFAVAMDYRSRRAARLRRPHPGLAPDFRRRGMVALRSTNTAGRPADPATAVSRLQGDRDEVCRADHVRARRHDAPQSAWYAGGAGALDCIRYLAAEAERRGTLTRRGQGAAMDTCEEIEAVDRERHDWMLSNREGITPHFEEVRIGARLPRRVHRSALRSRALPPSTARSSSTSGARFRWVAPSRS